jgi:hypothetical protein
VVNTTASVSGRDFPRYQPPEKEGRVNTTEIYEEGEVKQFVDAAPGYYAVGEDGSVDVESNVEDEPGFTGHTYKGR